jgi:glucose/arabinose dehydrogenase
MPGRAQTCALPAAAEWKDIVLVKGMSGPSHMAALPDGQVFVIEQWSGNVWLFPGPGKEATVIGTVPCAPGRKIEEGMLGIAADPGYATTHRVYVMHTPEQLGSHRLTRYTVAKGALSNPK